MDCDVFLCWWCGFAVKYPAQLISQLGGLSTAQREVSEVMGVLPTNDFVGVFHFELSIFGDPYGTRKWLRTLPSSLLPASLK